MNQHMRKALSALLLVAMMLSVLSVGAWAADGTYPIDASASVSGESTVLTLEAVDATVSGTISVTFDSSVLTCTDVEIAGTLTSVTVTEGCVTFGYATETDSAIASGETVATITFTGEVSSYTALDVTIADFNDQSGLDLLLPSVAIPEDALRFLDVPKGTWYYDAVEYTAQRGYFYGVGEQLFDPYGTMTRGMFVTVLGRMAGVQPWEYGTTVFTDVDPDSYYAGYVAWALETGITAGVSETEFAPYEPVTRQQAAAFMYRYAQWCGCDVTADSAALEQYADAQSISSYAWDAMVWAADTEILVGTGVLMNPRDSATRAQGAAMIQRLDLVLG